MGLLSQLLWEWRPDAACPEHYGRVMGIQCLRTASGWAAGPFVPCRGGIEPSLDFFRAFFEINIFVFIIVSRVV